jgi:hypothetical protein
LSGSGSGKEKKIEQEGGLDGTPKKVKNNLLVDGAGGSVRR